MRTNHLGQPIDDEVVGWHGALPPPRTPMVGRLCVLEPLDADRHTAKLYKAFSEDYEERMWTYLFVGPFETQAEFEAGVREWTMRDDQLLFAIMDRSSGAALGFASYLRIAPSEGSIEIGFLTYSPALQRTALATEAMYLMMRRAFDELGYRRYEWKCDALNAPSRRAAERLGFQFEGIFRQAVVYKGRNRDTAWYSVVNTEWAALKRAFEAWLSVENFDEYGRQRQKLESFR